MNFKLVTDHPDNNTERLMNLAYIKDEEIWLRLNPDEELCEFTARKCNCQAGCEPGITPEEVLEDGLLDCEDCPIAIMYSLAIQAATLREALKSAAGLPPATPGDGS